MVKSKLSQNTSESGISVKEKSYIALLFNNWGEISNTKKIFYLLTSSLCIIFAAFHIYTAYAGTLPAWQQRSIHISLALVILFLVNPLNKKTFKWYDIIPFILAALPLLYSLIEYPGQELRIGDPNTMDKIIAVILILLIVEATRRVNGLAMTIITVFFLVYIFAGPLFPGLLTHQGFRFSRAIDQIYNGTVGIFGTPLYVSSTVLALYVVWGNFLVKSGAGKFFTDISLAITGRLQGGPALSAVLSSALVGSITGNGAANVLITGSFTIPLMKEIGYEAKFAGAVEAVASQGGQIMPPIMGAAAFILAEYLGIPYIKVAIAALVPALLYFLVAGVTVYMQARKMNLTTVKKEDQMNAWEVFKGGFYFLAPIVLIIVLLVQGYSPMRAGFFALILTVALSYIKKETRMSLKQIFMCLEEGARSAIGVATACAAAGMIVGSISLTGIGIKFSRIAIEVAGGNVLVLLFMIMVASIILGMGMPTSSAYIILAVLGAPALVNAGITPLAAHLFVLYFGIISGLTPPVAITAYTAAGLAGSDPTKTALLSVKVGIAGFLVPFMFAYNNELLLMGESYIAIIQVIVTSVIGCIAFAIAMQKYLLVRLNSFEQLGLFVTAFLLINKTAITDIIGIALLALVIVSQIAKLKKTKQKPITS